jgi:hypothetical protein
MTQISFNWSRRKADDAAPIAAQPRGNPFHDRSLWLLLLANGITVLLAVIQNWNVLILMWVYWFQSIVIGFFNFLRIRQLGEFSTAGLTINGQAVEPTEKTKNRVARFFLLHYGFFHLVYFIFLLVFSQHGMFDGVDGGALSSADLRYIIPTSLLFLGNHVYSYSYNKPRDAGSQNIGTLMFYPYARIVPMHLTIILGGFLSGGLLLFLLLKTFADAIMHVVEHRILLRGGDTASGEPKVIRRLGSGPHHTSESSHTIVHIVKSLIDVGLCTVVQSPSV